MLTLLNKKLTKLDIFGHPINLNLDQRSRHKTLLGALVSIAIIILLLAYAINAGIQYIRSRSVNIATQTMFLDDTESLNFSNQEFMFAIRIADYQLFDTTQFDIIVQQMGQNGYYIELEQCRQEQFTQVLGNLDSSHYDLELINQWLCPKGEFMINLGGGIGTYNKQMLQISVKLCEKTVTSWGAICQSQTNNTNYKLDFIMTNRFIDPTNSAEPIKNYMDSSLNLWFTPESANQRTEYTFQKYSIVDYQRQIKFDELFDSQDVRDSFTNAYTRTLTGQPQTNLVELTFSLNNLKTIYVREYETLTDLFSKLGGLFQFYYLITRYIVVYYNKYQFYAQLANKLYDFKYDKKSHQDTKDTKLMEQNLPSQIQLLKSNENNQTNNHKKQHKKSSSDKKKEQEDEFANNPKLQKKVTQVMDKYKNQDPNFHLGNRKHFILTMFSQIVLTKDKLSMSLKFFIYKVFCLKASKDQRQLHVLQKAISRVKQELDVFAILDRIHQLEKLKNIIFDKDQLILFNYTPKPVVSLDDDLDATDFRVYQTTITSRRSIRLIAEEIKQSMKNRFIQKKKQLNVEQIYNAYQKISDQNRNSSRFYYRINNKLADYLGDNVKAIFKASKLLNFEQDDQDNARVMHGCDSVVSIENTPCPPKITQPIFLQNLDNIH